MLGLMIGFVSLREFLILHWAALSLRSSGLLFGQVARPFAHHVNMSPMISDRTRRIIRNGPGILYGSRGLGMAGLPLRINWRREIALIQLIAEPS